MKKTESDTGIIPLFNWTIIYGLWLLGQYVIKWPTIYFLGIFFRQLSDLYVGRCHTQTRA